jgi:hypothetical protein
VINFLTTCFCHQQLFFSFSFSFSSFFDYCRCSFSASAPMRTNLTFMLFISYCSYRTIYIYIYREVRIAFQLVPTNPTLMIWLYTTKEKDVKRRNPMTRWRCNTQKVLGKWYMFVAQYFILKPKTVCLKTNDKVQRDRAVAELQR